MTTTTTTTTTTKAEFVGMSAEERDAQQALFAEAKAAQSHRARRGGQSASFYWKTVADDQRGEERGDDGIIELHHATLTGAMESYEYADVRGWAVSLSAVVNGTRHTVRNNGGYRNEQPWLQVFVEDTSHVERVNARLAAE